MNGLSGLLLDLFVAFLAARIAAEIFGRLRRPVVIGELLAGILIGPFALGLIGHPDTPFLRLFHQDPAAAQEALNVTYDLLAELGVIVLLFFVGLETRLDDILRVGSRALLVGVFGTIVPFVLGAGLMLALGYDQLEAIFVATALVATSVGITARVLRELGAIGRDEARIILGAAVIDDILAMIFLAVVTGLAETGTVDLFVLGLIVAQAIGFTAFTVLLGRSAIRRFDLRPNLLKMDQPLLSIALIVMLGLAGLAGVIGLAAIIGAFLAGMVFADSRQQATLHSLVAPIYHFLVPFFFVITGSHVDWRMFLDVNVLGIALLITAVAIVGKLVGGGLPVWGMGRRSMAIVGVGMVPRGEVGLIVASLGFALGAFPREIFSVIVVMSVLTTIVVPPVLRALLPPGPHAGKSSEPA
jgi:Kef-type K+ transport system membrane component KefB